MTNVDLPPGYTLVGLNGGVVWQRPLYYVDGISSLLVQPDQPDSWNSDLINKLLEGTEELPDLGTHYRSVYIVEPAIKLADIDTDGLQQKLVEAAALDYSVGFATSRANGRISSYKRLVPHYNLPGVNVTLLTQEFFTARPRAWQTLYGNTMMEITISGGRCTDDPIQTMSADAFHDELRSGWNSFVVIRRRSFGVTTTAIPVHFALTDKAYDYTRILHDPDNMVPNHTGNLWYM